MSNKNNIRLVFNMINTVDSKKFSKRLDVTDVGTIAQFTRSWWPRPRPVHCTNQHTNTNGVDLYAPTQTPADGQWDNLTDIT